MADTTTRVFQEGEHQTLLSAAVERETAAAKTKISELEREKAELQTAKDVLEAEKAAETKRADDAVKALEDHKAEIERQAAMEAKRGERVAALKEAYGPLEVEIDEERSNRIVAMSDEVFEDHLATIREVAAKVPAKGADDNDADDADAAAAAKKKAKGMPRQSAAFGGGDSASTDTKQGGTVLGLLGARRGLTSQSA
jgi:colicin import membrane protein